MEEQPSKRSVVYAPAPGRHKWNFEISKSLGHVYLACAHKLRVGVESEEALYVESEAEDRFWCPSCRRRLS